MVDHAIGSLHLWLNLTLAVGVAVVFIGFVVSTLGGLGKRELAARPLRRSALEERVDALPEVARRHDGRNGTIGGRPPRDVPVVELLGDTGEDGLHRDR